MENCQLVIKKKLGLYSLSTLKFSLQLASVQFKLAVTKVYLGMTVGNLSLLLLTFSLQDDFEVFHR